MIFEEMQLRDYGYECITNFWNDFESAEKYGVQGVMKCYQDSFEKAKDDYMKLTELVLVVNHRCWNHYPGNEAFCRLYAYLYHKAAMYADKHLKGDEYDYYYRITD